MAKLLVGRQCGGSGESSHPTTRECPSAVLWMLHSSFLMNLLKDTVDSLKICIAQYQAKTACVALSQSHKSWTTAWTPTCVPITELLPLHPSFAGEQVCLLDTRVWAVHHFDLFENVYSLLFSVLLCRQTRLRTQRMSMGQRCSSKDSSRMLPSLPA